MWIFIMLAMGLVAIGSILYVTKRIYDFPILEKCSKGNKWLRRIASILPVAVVLGILLLWLGTINACICMIHLVIIWLLGDGILWLIQKVRKTSLGKSRHSVVGFFAILVTLGLLSYGWILAHHVWEVPYVLETQKNVGSFRVVQFADSHIGSTFHGKDLEKYVEQMQKTNPDIVVITGDYVDDDTSKQDMVDACRALGKLKPKYGVYYVFGNHDKGYYGKEYRGYDGEDLVAELEKNGVHVMEDEVELIDNRFYLIGRKDRSEEQKGGQRKSMEELTKNLDPSKYSIVLDHQPHDYENQQAAKVDLVLSGHTHGGQFFPINYVGEWSGENDMTYGLRTREQTNFIVTSGISDWVIQFKTGCKSEYVVVDIQTSL